MVVRGIKKSDGKYSQFPGNPLKHFQPLLVSPHPVHYPTVLNLHAHRGRSWAESQHTFSATQQTSSLEHRGLNWFAQPALQNATMQPI